MPDFSFPSLKTDKLSLVVWRVMVESRYDNVGNMRVAAPVMPSPYHVARRYRSLAVIEVAVLQ